MENLSVSIVVIAYNSSQTVLETLDSIKKQTFKNIELIVTDDASKDKTVEICKKWLEDNNNRFVHTELITTENNTGISANCNRGIKATTGEWIKIIAADDILLPTCIEDNVSHVVDHKHINIQFSRVRPIGNVIIGKQWPFLNPKPYFDGLTPMQFRILLCEKNFLPASSAFMRKSVWERLGGYEESIPLLEDWPMWMKAINNGYQFDFLNKETVGYRFSGSSISQGVQNKRYHESEEKTVELGLSFLMRISHGSAFFCMTMKNRHKNLVDKLLYSLNVFNPFYWQYRQAWNSFDRVREGIISETLD